MTLVDEYRTAKREEHVARLRRVLALRAMAATGMSQRQIADALGITQPAVSQQLKFGSELDGVHPEVLLEAAAPVLKALAAEHGYSRLAVFGSVARHDARKDSWFLLQVPPIGGIAFLLASGPIPGFSHPRSPRRRLTGGWAFLLSLPLTGMLTTYHW